MGIIFISHFLEQIYELCDRVTVLRNGELVGAYDVAKLPKYELIAKMVGKELSAVEKMDALEEKSQVFRPMHQFGMGVFATALRVVFGHDFADLFSGLRLFSERFYRHVPVLSGGFELEIELTLQALDKGFSTRDVPVPFRKRAEGSVSKLRTFSDGWRILRFLLLLFRDFKPLACFGLVAAIVFLLALAAGSVPVVEYLRTGLVTHFPLAILAASLVNVALILLLVGVLLQSSLRYHRERYQIELRKNGSLHRSGHTS